MASDRIFRPGAGVGSHCVRNAMYVSVNAFKGMTIGLGAAAVLMAPFWPWCAWGWMPSLGLGAACGMLFVFRALAVD